MVGILQFLEFPTVNLTTKPLRGEQSSKSETELTHLSFQISFYYIDANKPKTGVPLVEGEKKVCHKVHKCILNARNHQFYKGKVGGCQSYKYTIMNGVRQTNLSNTSSGSAVKISTYSLVSSGIWINMFSKRLKLCLHLIISKIKGLCNANSQP